MTGILLLDETGHTRLVELRPAPAFTRPTTPLRSRVIYAAAHVVPKAWADNVPGAPAELDWDATLAFRHHLWSWGLGVADAMDTAQRNMGLDWPSTAELIRRSAAEAQSVGGALVVGVNTDHVADESISLDEVIAAYLFQLEVAEEAGAGTVLMASRHLARAAESPRDYERVYRAVLSRASKPIVLHWLGAAFDANLAEYWGSLDVAEATETVLRIIDDNLDHVAGIKMSLLNAEYEIAVRARLPVGARMFTGDDFNYVGLIEGAGPSTLRDGRCATSSGQASSGTVDSFPELVEGPAATARHSDALLGAFAALGPSASAAIQALDGDDPAEYRRILGPTEELARQIFAAPTPFYKTGIAFLSWLNGHQPAFAMVSGLHSARGLPHLSEIVRLANEVGALEHPELAVGRWHDLLALNGIA